MAFKKFWITRSRKLGFDESICPFRLPNFPYKHRAPTDHRAALKQINMALDVCVVSKGLGSLERKDIALIFDPDIAAGRIHRRR